MKSVAILAPVIIQLLSALFLIQPAVVIYRVLVPVPVFALTLSPNTFFHTIAPIRIVIVLEE